MRKKIVAGNWKMNTSVAEGEQLAQAVVNGLAGVSVNAEVIIAPPFTHLYPVSKIIPGSSIRLAAQNCAAEESGAFTGEVSAGMLESADVTHVIIGHSERRALFGETNEVLLKKMNAALRHGLVPIYCIGETLAEREAGRERDVVNAQLEQVLFRLEASVLHSVIIAYEPVWAIGTGKTASPEQAQDMHAHIRSVIEKRNGKQVSENIRILYGGSCNASNVAQLFSQADIDGGLIGGASLKSGDFISVVKAAG